MLQRVEMRAENESSIDRVRRMESYFDCVRDAAEKEPFSARWDLPVQEMLQQLTAYFENGQWLADYICDEQGGFPPGLKRGVLSQDGLYDLLCGIK